MALPLLSLHATIRSCWDCHFNAESQHHVWQLQVMQIMGCQGSCWLSACGGEPKVIKLCFSDAECEAARVQCRVGA